MRVTDFFDTNVLLYLFSGEIVKADRAEALLAAGGVISVQVLNEFASVALRKLAMPLAEIQTVLRDIRRFCKAVPLTLETHEQGLELAQRYGFSLYDAMVVASAVEAGCVTLWSEDFQDGLRVEGVLTIRNPFKG
jgi:predicted nucleic acid-binding protein